MKTTDAIFKRIYCFVLFILISLTFYGQEQLLCDEGFENSHPFGTFPSYGCWRNSDAGGGADACCTTTSKHNGKNGLWEYTGIETWATWSGPYQEYTAAMGEVFWASVWIRTPSVSMGGSWVDGSKACLRVLFLNSNKSTLASKECPGITSIGTIWTQFNVTTDPAPMSTAFVRFICYIEKPQGVSGISVANFDDCYLEKITPVSTPIFNPPAGRYSIAQDITISCPTLGATIHYSTNGTDPTENSPVYNSPIQIVTSTTLKARAYKNSLFPSNVAIANYEISINKSDFSGSPISGLAPLSVQFTDKSTGTIISRLWHFGDGEKNTAQNPMHTYKSAGIYTVSLNIQTTAGNDSKTYKDYITVAPPIANNPIENAYSHLKEQFDQYHSSSYVYKDDDAGGNIFIPSIWQGEYNTITINQASHNDPFERSCTEITFPLKSSIPFSAIEYVYPDNNKGNQHGFNLSGTTELSFYAKGNGTVEFLLGGMNRRPFYADSLMYFDGVDIRSSGFIQLKNEWEYHTIDLTDNKFWVYLDSIQGLNNKFLQPAYMGSYNYFHFYYGADDGEGNKCMKINWFGGTKNSAGVFLFPPECNFESTQGYDLTGIKKIRFKARISQSGNVRFLFGKNKDSSGQLTKDTSLSTVWKWYDWELPQNKDYKNVIGGFGFYFGGNIGTPDNSNTYIDSVYYEGVKLAGDFSNLIGGFTVSANKSLNPNGADIYLDEIRYNKNRTDNPRFCQSFVCNSNSMDRTLKNRADVYDNSLKLLADLAIYNKTLDSKYLKDAILTGDAFVFAMQNDRFFKDNRLRNSYMSGEISNSDTVRVPGWWDDADKKWYEDIACVSTSTGNVAWAGLALISLFDITHEDKYKKATEDLAHWCIGNTQTDNGFAGGFTGFEKKGQNKIKWKSTEHNIDLYALYTRLYQATSKSEYKDAASTAEKFVLSMWNNEKHYFWTGTTDDGSTINNTNLPLDIQAWYIMAFRDSTSINSTGIDWANSNCYLENYKSPNYAEPLNGFDFNSDRDGIWFEGSSQAILANKMKGNTNFVAPVLKSIEYVQSNHTGKQYFNCNDKGIVAADHDHVSTGFDWEYNNRLHIGATCWFIFAELGINPYYINFPATATNVLPINASSTIVKLYPNPSSGMINLSIENVHNKVMVNIVSVAGVVIFSKEFMNAGNHIFEELNLSHASKGIYLVKVINGDTIKTEKLILR